MALPPREHSPVTHEGAVAGPDGSVAEALLPGAPPAGAASSSGALPVMLLVFAVFFLFGGITNLNDVLVPKLKGLFTLNNTQAMLVQFAFFTSYAIFSIPAGNLMRRLGYSRGLMLGFAIMAVSCLLFPVAGRNGSYMTFLIALFMIGGGITLLQVAVNPLIISVGDPRTAHSRLTFAQLFNSIGVFLIVNFGARVILGEEALADPTGLTGPALDAYWAQETTVLSRTYIGLAIILALIALAFFVLRGVIDRARPESEPRPQGSSLALLANPRLRFGVLCIFLYVGAEVAIASMMVLYLGESRTMGLDEKSAGIMMSYYWLGALIGRAAGGFLLRLTRPGWLLALFASAAILLITVSALSSGVVSGWAIVVVGLANSIMFPTIFSLATEGLTDEAPQASGLLCTAIVGGAIVPVLVGFVSDVASRTTALIVPAICYAVIAAFGLYAARHRIVPVR